MSKTTWITIYHHELILTGNALFVIGLELTGLTGHEVERCEDEALELNICSFQGHCYCRRRPIALFDDYCGSRPPLLRIKATGC